MIRNPYKNPTKRPRTWESEAGRENPQQHAPQASTNPRQLEAPQLNPPVASLQAGDVTNQSGALPPTGQVKVAPPQQQQQQQQSAHAPTNFDDSFDGGIDWEAASKVLDQVSVSHQQQQQQQQQQTACTQYQNQVPTLNQQVQGPSVSCIDPTNNISHQSSKPADPSAPTTVNVPLSQGCHASPVIPLQQAKSSLAPSTKERPRTAHGRARTPLTDEVIDWDAAANFPVKQLQSVAPKPQPLDTSQPLPGAASHPATTTTTTVPPPIAVPRDTVQDQMSSLRPAEWKARPPSSVEPQAKPSPSRCPTDLRQKSLPTALQFEMKAVQPVQDSHRQDLINNADLTKPLNNGWTLYSHQKRSIVKGLMMRRVILALDMGLGKTLIGCVWSRAFQRTFPGDVKVIVVCPVTLKEDWRRTAVEATGLTVQDDKQKSDICDDTTNVFICSWAKIPKEVSNSLKYVVVADEAHMMQSMDAARTKEALKLVLAPNCIGSLMLSGTPMKNGKPKNLFPLLKAVKHPFGRNQKAYETHFCDGKQMQYGRARGVWQANGSSNLGQLRELVASHLLHLTKDQVLKELPPQTRKKHHVPVSSRMTCLHNKAMQELGRVYNISKSMENGNDAILGAVQKLRMVSALAKVDATVALAKHMLSTEPAIVIFTGFVEVAKNVHKKLAEAGWDGELLTGETPPKKRQGMVDNFQNGISPVFTCTFGAGGVGLVSKAGRRGIRDWT
jgi:hypothetical protein